MAGKSQTPQGYMPQLDGLRSVAVIAVAVFHWHHPELFGVSLSLGTAGVNLFFVLSGFLITGILINVQRRVGDDRKARIVALKAFWMRRLFRLVPALLLYITVIYAVGYTGDREGLLWYLGYLANFRIADIGRWPVGTSHLWSLSVEEQFYIFIPFLVLWSQRARLGHVFVAGTAVSLIAFAFTGAGGRLLPPAAFVGLFIGCGCAVLFQRPDARRIGDQVSLLGLPVLVVVMLALKVDAFSSGLPESVLWLLYNVGAAGFVWRAAIGRAGRVLQSSPMVWIGRLSYGAYLWHFFVDWTFGVFAPDAPTLVRFLGAGFLTLAFAKLSFELVERRFIEKKVDHPYVKAEAVAVTT